MSFWCRSLQQCATMTRPGTRLVLGHRNTRLKSNNTPIIQIYLTHDIERLFNIVVDVFVSNYRNILTSPLNVLLDSMSSWGKACKTIVKVSLYTECESHLFMFSVVYSLQTVRYYLKDSLYQLSIKNT